MQRLFGSGSCFEVQDSRLLRLLLRLMSATPAPLSFSTIQINPLSPFCLFFTGIPDGGKIQPVSLRGAAAE